jgi:hypothetical protein
MLSALSANADHPARRSRGRIEILRRTWGGGQSARLGLGAEGDGYIQGGWELWTERLQINTNRQIQQTPDLTSLDPEHLPSETLAGLPYLQRVKDALYSSEFRNFIRELTGCGPLSGKKTDGSVALYSQGYVYSLLHLSQLTD